MVAKRCGWGKLVPYLEEALKVTLMPMQMGFCKFIYDSLNDAFLITWLRVQSYKECDSLYTVGTHPFCEAIDTCFELRITLYHCVVKEGNTI